MDRQQIDAESIEAVKSSQIPSELKSARAKLVYHSLAAAGGATPNDLAERLSVRKTTLYPILATLRERDLVVVTDGQIDVRDARGRDEVTDE